MKVYLVRHGETTGDIEDRYGGSYDDHLTEKGRAQLGETAQKLVDKGIEIIFSSPLIRARESAEIIAAVVGVPVEAVEGLRERHYGVLTGLTKEEARQQFLEAVELHADPQNTDPEGESQSDFNNRVAGTFQSIFEKSYKTVVIVSHGGPIKQIYRYLGKGELGKLGDGEILEIEV